MRSMSENARLFGSLARYIRRSTCPTTDCGDEIRCLLRRERRSS
jgi:hypothetical protein